MRRRAKLAGLAALVLLAVAPSSAHAATNDAFSAPIALSPGAAPLLVDNIAATSELSEPDPNASRWLDCGNLTVRPECGGTVWFTFTAPATTSYVIETCDVSTELDTALAVYTGAALGSLATVASNDDACDGGGLGYGSRVTIAASAGITYRAQVGGFEGHSGTFYIRAYPSAAPPAGQPVETRITSHQSVAAGAPDSLGAGAQSGARQTASFGFTSTGAADATFQCSLDDAPFTPCSSPVSYDDLPADGAQHRFLVRATTAGATDPTPAAQVFTLDQSPPDTTLVGGPAEGASVSNPLSFMPRGTERTPDFLSRCSIDGSDPLPCNRAEAFSVDKLCNGPHSFRAAAMDGAGNLDPTPLTRGFVVTAGAACAPPALGTPTVSPSPTQATVTVPLTTGGAPVTTTLHIGPTSAYGDALRVVWRPASASAGIITRGLAPLTTYHYEVTAKSATGASATTGDNTFTTPALPGGAAQPSLTVGDAQAAGMHAARIPITTDVGAPAQDTQVLVFIDDHGPISTTSPSVLRDYPIPAATTGVISTPIDLVDLKPATTYHYRVLAAGSHNTLTAERTFRTPDVPDAVAPVIVVPAPGSPVPVKVNKYFLIAKNLVSGAAINRRSRKVTVKVRGLPAGTKVTGTVKGRTTLGRASGKAGVRGTVTLKITLGRAARRALKGKRLKKVTITVSASPPGDVRSTVTLTRSLKR